MRKVLWISLMSAAIATTGACRKHDADKNYDQASKQVEKAKDDVRDQQKDVRDEQKDVTKEQKDVSKEQGDVAKQEGELNAAKTDLDRARVEFSNATRTRLATLDTKLEQLQAKTTDKARSAYVDLKARRDALATRVHDMESRNADMTKDVRKDIDDSFDKLEKDINGAL